MTKRWTMKLLASVALMVATGTAMAQAPQRFDGITLRVATYGGGWDKAVHEGAGAQFEALGGKVEYVLGSPANHLAKLIAARGGAAPFDVFDIADSTMADVLEGGFVQKFNPANIPNLKALLPSQYTEYAIAGWSSQEGIMYNVERFKALGLPAPERYSDLANPKLAGRVQAIDVSTSGSAQFIVAAARDAGGDEAHLDKGFEVLKKIKPVKYYKVGSEALLNLKIGEVDAVITSAGFTIQGKRDNVPVAFVHPTVGKNKGVIKEALIGIAKGTPQQRAAEFFLNAYLAEESQFILAKRRGIVPANPQARARLAEDPIMRDVFLLGQDKFANMMRVDWSKLNLDAFTDQWNRTVAR